MAKIVRAISNFGGVIITAVNSTDIVSQAEKIHGTSAVVTAALGRLLTGASLMGSLMQSREDEVTLRVKGDGPIGMLLAVSDGLGNVRGYVQNEIVELPASSEGKLDVGTAVGRNGLLAVVKDLGLKEPYVGQVPLVSGEIAEDITAYYAASEHIPTVCALGVLVDNDLSCKTAGGFIIQALPGATDEELTLIENNIKGFKSVTAFFEQDKTVYDLINLLMAGFEPEILDETEVSYLCNCDKARVERALISIGKQDLAELCEQDGQIEMACQFCGKKYVFNKPEIEHMLKTI